MKRLPVFALLVLTFTGTIAAQAPDNSPDKLLGRRPYASYFDADIDSVNTYNGNLLLDITLFTLPGRELPVDLRVTYNSKGWQAYYQQGIYHGGTRVHTPVGQVYLNLNLVSCELYSPYPETYYEEWEPSGLWIDGAGIYHSYTAGLVSMYRLAEEGACADPPYSAVYELSPATAGDPWMITEGAASAKIVFKDGSVLDGSSGRLITPNGNFLDGLQDTLGRTIVFSTNQPGPTPPLCDYTSTAPVPYYKRYTIKDASGQDQTYTLNFENNHFTANPVEGCWEHLDGWLTSIVLPNGQSYQFEYANYQGYLTKVTLPSGAYIRYDYYGGNQTGVFGHDYVTERHVSADGTSGSEKTWTYSRVDYPTTREVTVTSPESHQVKHTFNSLGQETQTVYLDSSGTLQTITTTWTNGRPSQIDTQTGSATRRTTMGWFTWTGGDFLSYQEDTDWALVPRTKVNYFYHQFPGSILLRPLSTELLEWNGSQYERKGLTEFVYDQYSVQATPSNVPNKTSPPHYDRGNPTTIRRYKDLTNYIEEHLYYDDVGNVVQAVDALNHSTTFDYTDNFTQNPSFPTHAFLKKATNHLNQSYVTNKYDYNTGLLKSVLDTRTNLETTMSYDSLNRLTGVSEQASQRVTTYTYTDTTPKVTEEVLVAAGQTRKVETIMDKLYRPLQVTLFDPDGDVKVDTLYDDDGRVWKASLPYRGAAASAWTETTYDGLGRPKRITNPDSTYVDFSYADNQVTTTDEAGIPRRVTYNAAGQLSMVEELNPEEPNPTLSTNPLVTTYAYEVFGPLKQVTQGAQTRTFTYDWLGRLTQEVHPETGSTTYAYYPDGTATRTDARGIVTNYVPDEIGRLEDVTYNDGTPPVHYDYDLNGFTGFLTNVSVSGVAASSFEYFNSGLLKKETVTLLDGVSGSFVSEYTYDYDGRLLTAKYPSGRIVEMTYDSSGNSASDRLDSLGHKLNPTAQAVPLLQSIQDNAAGLITGRTLVSPTLEPSVVETRQFNARNQLTRIAAAANGAALLDLGYGYGSNVGRIRSRTDAIQPEHSANYSFDELYRLENVTGGDSSWSIAWTLDRYGNRTTQTPTGLASGRVGSPSLTYADNKISGWGYDAAGNLTNDGVGGHNYTYDAENRLIQIDSSAIQYAYDYAGRRIKRTVSGTTTYYFYGLTGLMSEFSTQSGPTGAASTDRLQYRVGEQTGTAVMLVDPDGTPRENNRVFPFGEPWLSFTSSNNSEKFTTYQHDGESDLDYAMARYYASRNGRFMTPDPGHVGANVGNPQSWNVYTYAGNDPVNAVDPSGLEPTCYLDGIETECGFAERLLMNGAAAQCPDNLCSFIYGGQYYQFVAAAGGASGYVEFQDLANLYESGGNLFLLPGGGSGGAALGDPAGQAGSGQAGGGSGGVWRGFVNVLGYIWNGPNTVLGTAYGLIGIPTGGIGFEHGQLQFRGNLLQRLLSGNSGAITLGDAGIYPSGFGPQTPGTSGPTAQTVGLEESYHSRQGRILGPAYLPANLVGGILGLIVNGSWHGGPIPPFNGANFMERGPHANPPRRW